MRSINDDEMMSVFLLRISTSDVFFSIARNVRLICGVFFAPNYSREQFHCFDVMLMFAN